jgi:hypothetical protein
LHYLPDELAQTISLGPVGDGKEGQDWVLTYTPEQRNEDDREKALRPTVIRSSHLPQEKSLVLQERRKFLIARCIPFIDVLNAAKNTLRNHRTISVLGVALRVVASKMKIH